MTGTPQELILSDAQIVNGLQTSQVVYDSFKDSPESLREEKRHIVIRIIKSTDAIIQDRVIRATNSQTAIPPAFLWATDEHQRDIEQYFRASGLHYDRRKNSWRKQNIPIAKVVGMTELAQSVAAIVSQEPKEARRSPSIYFKKERYSKVFSPSFPLDTYIVCARLRKAAEEFLRSTQMDKRHRNNVLFYLLMVVVCLKLKTPRSGVRKISKISVESITPELFQEASAIVLPVYKQAGESDQAAKGTKMTEDLKSILKNRFAKDKALAGARA